MTRSPSVSLLIGGRDAKSSQNRSYDAVVVAQRADGLAEARQVAELVERIAGVARHAAEQVGAQHRRDHRAEPAAGLARDAAVRGRRRACDSARRRTARPRRRGRSGRARSPASRRTGCRRTPSTRRRTRRRTAGASPRGEQRVGGLGERRPERRAVVPHRQRAGVALDHVDRSGSAARDRRRNPAARRPRAGARAGSPSGLPRAARCRSCGARCGPRACAGTRGGRWTSGLGLGHPSDARRSRRRPRGARRSGWTARRRGRRACPRRRSGRRRGRRRGRGR